MRGYIIEVQYRNPGEETYTTAVFTREALADAEHLAASMTEGVDGRAAIHPIGEAISSWWGGDCVVRTEEKR